MSVGSDRIDPSGPDGVMPSDAMQGADAPFDAPFAADAAPQSDTILTPPMLADLWRRIGAGLRQDLGGKTFDHWLKHVRAVGHDAETGVISLTAPSSFTANWVSQRFGQRLAMAWALHVPGVTEVVIGAASPVGVTLLPPLSAGGVASASGVATGLLTAMTRPKRPTLEDRLTFATFITARSNILALSAARRIAAVEKPQFHPLYLRSETGQGKTHLLHSIATATLERAPDACVILMSAEKFMVEFVSAMRANAMMEFKARLRAADLLLIDDLQFVIGKDSTQSELLHTIDDVISSGGRLVVAADRLPHRLDGIDQRLLSRLSGGLVADIEPPERDLRIAILEQKAAALAADIPTVVIDWIADHFPRNVRELEGALNKLVAYGMLSDQPIDLAMAEDRLLETARGSRARVTIEDIQRAVCAHFRIDRAEMASERRTRAVARPRQIAMYLAKELTPRSYPEIGRRFGGRDHSTVIHAVKTIDTLRVKDADIEADIRRIRAVLSS